MIAIAGFGGARHDAEGNQLAGGGGRNRQADRCLECREILQHVIRGQDQHDRVIARELARRMRRQRDGRRGVAPHRL